MKTKHLIKQAFGFHRRLFFAWIIISFSGKMSNVYTPLYDLYNISCVWKISNSKDLQTPLTFLQSFTSLIKYNLGYKAI